MTAFWPGTNYAARAAQDRIRELLATRAQAAQSVMDAQRRWEVAEGHARDAKATPGNVLIAVQAGILRHDAAQHWAIICDRLREFTQDSAGRELFEKLFPGETI